jgi:hypothetical protein
MVFKKKEKIPLLLLAEVYKKIGIENEKQFVRKFFTQNVLIEILEDCGIEISDEDIDIQYDYSLKFGKGTIYPDILLSIGDQTFYFEVMSQTNGGGWDDDHHRQLAVKKQALEVEYGCEIMCFAVAFKEFDTEYQPFFKEIDNCYGMHISFDQSNEYSIDVLGLDMKKEKYDNKVSDANKVCEKWSKILSENGLECIPEKIWKSYSNIGKPYNGSKRHVQFLFKNKDKLGIKLHGDLYKHKNQNFKWMVDEPDLVCGKMEELTGIKFTNSAGVKDKTFIFDFNKDNMSQENVDLLILISNAFREVSNIDK